MKVRFLICYCFIIINNFGKGYSHGGQDIDC